MDANNIILIIFHVLTPTVSLAALIVSIISLVLAKKREKNRKLKDSLMGELATYYNSLRTFIFHYTENKEKATPQQIISTLKYHSVQFSAIKSVVNEMVVDPIQDLDIVEAKFQEMRRVMTDAVEFIEAVSTKKDFVFADGTVREIEELNAEIYKCIMKSQYKINNTSIKQ